MTRVLDELREAERRRAAWVGRALVACVLVGFVVVLGRVVQLQVAPSEALKKHADDRSARYSALARRGDIRDRKGRIIAATRTGSRLFLDPARLEPDADGTFDALLRDVAGATGEEVSSVAQRLLPRIEENERRRASAGEEAPSLIRYVSIGSVLPDDVLGQARALAESRKGVHLEEVTAREMPAGNLLAAVIGKVGTEGTGLAGLEAGYEQNLEATPGFVEPVLDARGNALWVQPTGYVPSQAGTPIRLSIDLELQRIVVEELNRRCEELDAAGARCVVIDPETGELLAMADVMREVDAVKPGSEEHLKALEDDQRVRVDVMTPDPVRALEPALARVRCAVDIYEPGSTFKPFVWAALVERGEVGVDERFETNRGRWTTEYGRTLTDVSPLDHQTWTEVLVHSSNIGMAKGAERLEPAELREDVLHWGFGAPTGLPVPGEAGGLVTSRKNWTKLTQSSVPMGYEVGVTPLQMVRAFSAFARSGNRAGELPNLSLEALLSGDARLRLTQRLLRPSTAEAAKDAMRRVAEKMAQRTPHWIEGEPEFGYTIFGKSGTAKTASPMGGYLEKQYTSSFIAGAPFENTRLVVVVVIEDPGPAVVDERHYYGSMTAGPALLRIMRRSLEYLGVAPDRVEEVAEG